MMPLTAQDLQALYVLFLLSIVALVCGGGPLLYNWYARRHQDSQRHAQ